MKNLLLILFISIFSSCGLRLIDEDATKVEIKKALEEAYFEGQKDGLTNDVRIAKISDSCWIWTKSPWNNGDKPLFNPSIVCNRK